MKHLTKVLLPFVLFFCMPVAFAGVVDLTTGTREVYDISVKPIAWGTTLEKVQNGGMSLLRTFKVIIGALAVIYMVYAGIQMIMAMGNDDKALSAAKRTLYYAITAFLFVNIPGQLVEIFAGKKLTGTDVTSNAAITWFTDKQADNTSNLFFNLQFWRGTIEEGVISFIKIMIFAIAVFMFTFWGIQMIASGGDDKARAAARSKILWGVGALIFVGLIQVWINIVYSGNVSSGQWFFAKLANMALFFAGPTAIIFLLFGGYLFVTSAGDEEKAKKGKNIVINTAIATLILLASYTFLKDLADLKFF